MKIISFAPSSSTLNKFINFGIECQRGHKNAIPVNARDEHALFDPRKNSFFKKGKIMCFIAEKDRNPIARAAAMINEEIIFNRGRLGLIGFFDVCSKHYSKEAKEMIIAAENWLRAQGCTHVQAPVDFSIWHRYRFTLNSDSEKPFMGLPSNPHFYVALFEESDYIPNAFWINRFLDRMQIEKIRNKYAEQGQLALESGYRAEQFSIKRKALYLEFIWETMQEVYATAPDFSPIPKSEFIDLYSGIAKVVLTEATIFLRTPADKLAGFVIVFRDLAKALKAMNGKTGLWSKFMFLLNSQTDTAIYYLIAVKKAERKKAYKTSREKMNINLSLGKAIVYFSCNAVLQKTEIKKFIVPFMREGAMSLPYTKGFYKETKLVLLEKNLC